MKYESKEGKMRGRISSRKLYSVVLFDGKRTTDLIATCKDIKKFVKQGYLLIKRFPYMGRV